MIIDRLAKEINVQTIVTDNKFLIAISAAGDRTRNACVTDQHSLK